MKKIKTSNIQGLLVGQIIVGVIGAILLLVDDFAGYYHYDYYNKIRTWGYIYLGSGFFSSVLIVITAALLLYTAYSAVKIIRKKDVSKNEILKHTNTSTKSGMIVLAIAIISGLVFAITNIAEETQEWWFDAGFYAALIAGASILYFGKQIKEKLS